MKSTGPANQTFRIQFDDLDEAAANQAALSLREFLLDQDLDVEVKIEKSSGSTQDFGSILVLLLGTKAVIEIAKGIADWLRRRADASTGLVIVDVDGNHVKIKGLAAGSVDVARIARALGNRDAPASGSG
jgi:hypothetical protein